MEIKKRNFILGFPKIESSIIIGTGGYSPNFEQYFDGVIGDIRIYNRVLTRKEVCEISRQCPIIEAMDRTAKNKTNS